MTNTTELAALPFAFQGKHGSSLAHPKDIPHIYRRLPPVSGFRVEQRSNSWSYAFAAYLVDQLSDVTWDQCVVEPLTVLGMSRTSIFEGLDDNFARPYVTFSDGRPVKDDLATLEGRVVLDGTGATMTCATDMFKWCKALIQASKLAKVVNEEGQQAIFPMTTSDSMTLNRERLLKALWTIQQPRSTRTYDVGGMGLYTSTLPTIEINNPLYPSNITSSHNHWRRIKI